MNPLHVAIGAGLLYLILKDDDAPAAAAPPPAQAPPPPPAPTPDLIPLPPEAPGSGPVGPIRWLPEEPAPAPPQPTRWPDLQQPPSQAPVFTAIPGVPAQPPVPGVFDTVAKAPAPGIRMSDMPTDPNVWDRRQETPSWIARTRAAADAATAIERVRAEINRRCVFTGPVARAVLQRWYNAAAQEIGPASFMGQRKAPKLTDLQRRARAVYLLARAAGFPITARLNESLARHHACLRGVASIDWRQAVEALEQRLLYFNH